MVTIRSKSYARTPTGIRYGDMPWDGILGLAGSLVSTAGSVKAAKYAANKQLEATRETNAANAALAKAQNDFNLDMWNRSNEYNTTSAQMERWRDAGLNPNSFTGTPYEAAPIQSADLANQVAPDLSALRDVGPAIQRGLDQGLAFLQLDLAKKKTSAEIQNLDVQNETLRAQSKDLLKSVGLKDSVIEKNKAEVDYITARLGEVEATINNLNAQANAAYANANDARLRQKMLRETWDEQKLSYKLENDLKKLGIALSRQQCANFAQDFKTKVFETAIKGNEFSMLEFNNWLTKVLGATDVMSRLNENERKSVMSKLFSLIDSALEDAQTETEKETVNPRYGWRNEVMRQAQSWQNPVMP